MKLLFNLALCFWLIAGIAEAQTPRPARTIGDASRTTYTPGTLGDWTGSADPGQVDDALDQAISRVKAIEDAAPAGIGGSVGATDNAVPRANGTGGATLQGSGVTIDDSNNISTPGTVTTGSGGGTSGSITLSGSTSGLATITVPAVAGTPANIQLPSATGTAGQFLTTDGATPQVTSWTSLPNHVKSQILQLSADGTQCADPAYATINSGVRIPTIICTDNDAATIFGFGQVPDSWAGGTFTFEVQYVQTAADTGALVSDISAACRGPGDTMNNVWGTEVAVDDAAVTGSSGLDHTTSAAVTPNGTCVAGDTLFVRLQIDAATRNGGTTTLVASLHFLAIKAEYTVTGAGSD